MPRVPYRQHIDDTDAFAIRLRDSREFAGLSQRQVSFPGCSPAYISRIEGGERVPSLQIIRELASRIGVGAEWLATGEEYAQGDVEAVRQALAAFKRVRANSATHRRGYDRALDDLLRSIESML